MASRRQLTADVTAVLALGGFGILKAYALAPAFSDENIYFYMCRRIAEGALPYRDFFFAHPPFHLIPGTLVMSVFGFSLPLAKAIPAVFAAQRVTSPLLRLRPERPVADPPQEGHKKDCGVTNR